MTESEYSEGGGVPTVQEQVIKPDLPSQNSGNPNRAGAGDRSSGFGEHRGNPNRAHQVIVQGWRALFKALSQDRFQQHFVVQTVVFVLKELSQDRVQQPRGAQTGAGPQCLVP